MCIPKGGTIISGGARTRLAGNLPQAIDDRIFDKHIYLITIEVNLN